MRRLAGIAIACAVLIFSAKDARAWGSVETTGAFATHQFLNEKAYEELRRQRAFKYANFPPLADIQRHSGVSAPLKMGLGPDDGSNADYDWHWYNPWMRTGITPDKVEEYTDRLEEDLAEMMGYPPTRAELETLSHNAAYAAHFIQDMTCPFHVFGIPRGEVDKFRIGTRAETGPYHQDYTREGWKDLVERFLADTDHAANFFDATYYDGTWPMTTMTSTHFEYEAIVELNYKHDYLNADAAMTEFVRMYGYLPDGWTNGTDLPTLTHQAADTTRRRIGTREEPGPLWLEPSTVKWHAKVPYYEWHRAIQLTYVLWRQSFSALHVLPKQITLVKVSNKKDAYRIRVRVWNLENKAEAENVKIEYAITGPSSVARGSGAVKRKIGGQEESDPVDLGGEITIEDPDKREGEITLTITGKFTDPKLPDSGKKVVEYALKDIPLEAVKLDDVRGRRKDVARKFLEEKPRSFKVIVGSAGDSETPKKAFTVKSQDPAAGTWVAPGDTITLKAYDEYLVEVPKVIGMRKAAALEVISKTGLVPKPGDVMVEHTEPEGIVLSQDPSSGRVAERTSIAFRVSKRKQAPPQADEGTKEHVTAWGRPPQQDDYTLPLTPVLQAVALRDIETSPAAVRIKIGQFAKITAIPIDIDGNPVRGDDLGRFTYNWIVNDPSRANISGAGLSALVSGIKPGTVQAVVTAGGAMGIATIIIEPGEADEERDLATHHEFMDSEGVSDSAGGWTSEPSVDDDTAAGDATSSTAEYQDNVAQQQQPALNTEQVNADLQAQQTIRRQQAAQQSMQVINFLGQALGQVAQTRTNRTSSGTVGTTRSPIGLPTMALGSQTGGYDSANAGGYRVSPPTQRPGYPVKSPPTTIQRTPQTAGSSSGGLLGVTTGPVRSYDPNTGEWK